MNWLKKRSNDRFQIKQRQLLGFKLKLLLMWTTFAINRPRKTKKHRPKLPASYNLYNTKAGQLSITDPDQMAFSKVLIDNNTCHMLTLILSKNQIGTQWSDSARLAVCRVCAAFPTATTRQIRWFSLRQYFSLLLKLLQLAANHWNPVNLFFFFFIDIQR